MATSTDYTEDSYELYDGVNEESTCKNTTAQVIWYMYLIISITGCVANIVLFLLLHLKAHVSVTNFLLKWLALMDGLFLAITAFKHGLCHQYCWVWNLLVYSLERTIQLCSLWSIVVLAVFRYIAICKPFQVHRYLTYTRAYVAVSLCFVGSLLVNLPLYIMALDMNNTVSFPWLFYQVYIGVIYFSALYFFLPFSVLVLVNVCMLRGLYKLNKDSSMATKNNTEMTEVTKVVLAIIVVFIVSYASFPLYWIDWYFYRRALTQLIERTCIGTFFYSFIYEILPVINASVNLYIHALLRQSFRQNIKTMFPCC